MLGNSQGGKLFSAMIIPTLVVFSLLLAVPPEQTLSFEYLPSADEDDNSWLSMTCSGSANLEQLTCSFVNVRIRQPSEEFVTAKIREASAKVRSGEEDEELKKECARRATQEVRASVERSLRTGSPERRAVSRQERDQFNALCSCAKNDRECQVKAAVKLVEGQIRVCQLSSEEFHVEFKRAGKNKWISNPGPQGACNVVTMTIIERESGSGNWTYTQTRLTADTDEQNCAWLRNYLNVPTRYSWIASENTLIGCERVGPIQ